MVWEKSMTDDSKIKRSRRVVLTMMGSAAVGAVSMGFVPRDGCPPGSEPALDPRGRLYCRAFYGGFGGYGYGGHDHGHSHGFGG
jgi:hypothetical protein